MKIRRRFMGPERCRRSGAGLGFRRRPGRLFWALGWRAAAVIGAFPSRRGAAEVWAGNSAGYFGPLVEAFKPRTKEGIGMGSTLEDVVRVFGKPRNSHEVPQLEMLSMSYDAFGLDFHLRSNRAHHIIVRFKLPKK